MSKVRSNPRIHLVCRSPIKQEVTGFLIDRQARGVSPRTIEECREKLAACGDCMSFWV